MGLLNDLTLYILLLTAITKLSFGHLKTGYITNCPGTPPGINITIIPGTIRKNSAFTYYYQYNGTPMVVEDLTLDLKIYVPFYDFPIYQDRTHFNCKEEAIFYIRMLYPDITCPLNFHQVEVITRKVRIPESIVFYEGEFKIWANFTDTLTGNKVFCLTGELELVD